MIKYLGSKRALLDWIVGVVKVIDKKVGIRTILDPFSGSARVGHALKREGFYVIASDYAAYAFVLAKALVESDAREYPPEKVQPLLQYLNTLSGEADWFTEKYAIKARFFQPHNATKIEVIRKAIDEVSGYDENLKAILLTSLMMAADKVDSTTGIQMAYLKRWASRAYKHLHLTYPPLLPGKGMATQLDALEAVQKYPVDLVYLDPPYNQHSYLSNYHIWETLVLFDNPKTYGIAQKRIDVQERKSPFNFKKDAPKALKNIIDNIQAKVILLSFNNEGFLTEEEIKRICSNRGYVTALKHPYKRYVGAQIGIYNQFGEKVGKISHLNNEEMLFIISSQENIIKLVEEEYKKERNINSLF